jgi:hypothetical protein
MGQVDFNSATLHIREQDPSTYWREMSADELFASLIDEIVSRGMAETFLAARGFTPQPIPQSDHRRRIPLAVRNNG